LNILTVKNVTKVFGKFRAVDNVSIEIQSKHVNLIMGPNGSGKTTLLNCISGFYKPDQGNIIFDGMDVTGKPPHEIARRGLIRTFQIPAPFFKLSILENLLAAYQHNPGEKLFHSLFKRTWLKKEREAVRKAQEVLSLLNLNHLASIPAENLSGGQLKLLEMGRALMTEAKMILLDEPVGSVNPTLAHQIFKYIQTIREEREITFLMIEHRLDIAMQYVDIVCAMIGGKIVCQGKPDEVLHNEEVINSYLGG